MLERRFDSMLNLCNLLAYKCLKSFSYGSILEFISIAFNFRLDSFLSTRVLTKLFFHSCISYILGISTFYNPSIVSQKFPPILNNFKFKNMFWESKLEISGILHQFRDNETTFSTLLGCLFFLSGFVKINLIC